MKRPLHLCSVVGARPQFVKAAVFSRALSSISGVSHFLIHTGQHHDVEMSEVFFQEMRIPRPRWNLGVHGEGHGVQTGRMMESLERCLTDFRPDAVVVYGDTNSTLAAALVSAKMHIPLAHVEAGLRSFQRQMPEEINRIVTDHVSDVLYAPTQAAKKQLLREGIAAERIHKTGDIMYDAVLYYREEARRKSRILENLGCQGKDFVLATVHRPVNTDDIFRLKTILKALRRFSKSIKIIMPLHPRTLKCVRKHKIEGYCGGPLVVTKPLGYFDMIRLESEASLIVTDSGGVQKEAFFFKTPCVTLREETEWIETVSSGWNALCPPVDVESVCQTMKKMLGSRGRHQFPFGHGKSGEKMAAHLLGYLRGKVV